MTLPDSGSYVLDPANTTIGCDVRAMFGLMNVHGTLKLISGQFTVDPDVSKSTVTARIAADSYESGNDRRDRDVKSANLLDAKKYPEISYSGTGVRQDGNDWIVTGSVTAHGATVPAELRITSVRVDGNQVAFEAGTTLDRTEFGVTKKKGQIARAVTLSINASGTRMNET
jgi:polyisoprenoid-binding protein YceI